MSGRFRESAATEGAEPTQAAEPARAAGATQAPRDAPLGLTADEVRQRISDGRTNDVPEAPVRTVGQIMRANVLTPVNAIIATMFALIIAAGFPADALFAGVVVSNSIIGIAQELKARRTLHELAVLSAPRARVVRDGRTSEVRTSAVVADDVLELRPGDQVVADGEVVTALGLQINESLLTGESEPVDKAPGHDVMSGSFVSAGTGWYRATAIGADSYAARLSEEARRFKLAGSELKSGVNTVLRWLTVIIPPAALLLLTRLLATEDLWQEALRGTVAAAVAMVPDGLVLLTSLSFITGVIVLARHHALAKELASVELLARVDTLCLDKTGTITTGAISLERVEPLGAVAEAEAAAVLEALVASDPAPNATLAAIGEGVARLARSERGSAAGGPDGSRASGPGEWVLRGSVPFSSARKWAAAGFEGRGVYCLGAPDVLLADGGGGASGFDGSGFDGSDFGGPDSGDAPDAVRNARVRAADAAASGARVLVVTRSEPDERNDSDRPSHAERRNGSEGLGDSEREELSDVLPARRVPVCLVHLSDTVREDAAEIFAFFRDQSVSLKVISGDHPATVAAVARRAGITRPGEDGVDARILSDDPEQLADALESETVFGRVTPHHKRAMVQALQSRGRTVAMTGDGVNDVLALKDADMGIAMGTGSSSTRAVAQLVLLDDRFATLPRVLAEGRRVINNIERVANLFITKAAYAVLLTVLIGAFGSPFPFLPRHLTLIGTFSTGVPGFFLALSANDRLVKRGFLPRVLRFSLPAGAAAATATFALYETVRRLDGVRLDEARTCATVTLLGIGLVILVLISRPMRPWKVGLAASMAASYAVTMAWSVPRGFFRLDPPPAEAWLWVAAAVVVGGLAAWLSVELAARFKAVRPRGGSR